jgi:hypothetical protein
VVNKEQTSPSPSSTGDSFKGRVSGKGYLAYFPAIIIDLQAIE